jgi:hypothetical protein
MAARRFSLRDGNGRRKDVEGRKCAAITRPDKTSPDTSRARMLLRFIANVTTQILENSRTI